MCGICGVYEYGRAAGGVTPEVVVEACLDLAAEVGLVTELGS